MHCVRIASKMFPGFLLGALLWMHLTAAVPAGKNFFAASSDSASGGIHQLVLTAGNRIVSVKFQPLARAGYLLQSSDGKLLYALGRVKKKDVVAVFSLPELEKVGTWQTGGRTSCHLTISPDGKRLYTANYSSSSISEIQLDDNGVPVPGKRRIIKLSGKGADPIRQKRSHPHWVGFDPAGTLLAVADLGADTLVTYPYNTDSGISPARAIINPASSRGAGPRHLVFAPSGKLAAAVNELDNTTVLYCIKNGTMRFADGASTLSANTGTPSFAGAIRQIPSSGDRFTFAVTNRGEDTVAFFAVDCNGKLQRRSSVSSGGGLPSDILPLSADTLLVANMKGNNIRVLCFDRQSRKWLLTEKPFSIPSPICLSGSRLAEF